MNKENKKYIDEFVESIQSLDTVKVNIKASNENIKVFIEQGEEEYRKIYSNSTYSLTELKYFRSELRKRKKTLELEEKRFKYEYLL